MALVKKLGWLGMRTERYEEMISFLRDTLGMTIDHADEDAQMTAFKLDDGSAVEVFGPQDDDHRFFTTGPVVGFVVDDVVAARSELESKGVEFIGEVKRGGGMAWAHFRAPDGNVYEITEQ